MVACTALGRDVRNAGCRVSDSSDESNSDSEEGDDREETGSMEGSSTSEESCGRQHCVNEDALREEFRTPLFNGSSVSRLDATLLVMNACRTHKATNTCINELLRLLSTTILPTPNSMPPSVAEATKMLDRLGLQYNSVHACRNGCILFRKEHADMERCPSCQSGRYRFVGQSRVPWKVLRHFPLIPRLKRMFSTPELASLMTWHSENISKDGAMRGPYDAPQWDHVRREHALFEEDSRNLHLGLCADGVNPYSQQHSTHSMCPVLLLNYNVPPWLTTKNFFMMVSLLIPGPDAATGDNFDVFIAPLIEELTLLWTEGVMCTDAARWRGEARFSLRAILLWCLHDFPAYAMVAGTTNKGYCACPVCGPHTVSRFSEHLSKVVYGGSHRRWLPDGHPFRRDEHVFATEELLGPPPTMDAEAHVRWAFLRAEYTRFGGRMAGEGDPMLCSGVKRLPALFTLPYWKVRPRNSKCVKFLLAPSQVPHTFSTNNRTNMGTANSNNC